MIVEYILIGLICWVALMVRSMLRDLGNESVEINVFYCVLASIFFPITSIIILVRIYKRISEWL